MKKRLVSLLVVLCAVVTLGSCSKNRNPVILLRSGWQVENIGDVSHTPGFLATVEKYYPEADVIFWPFYGLLPEEEVAMLKKRFPRLTIVRGTLDDSGAASTSELADAFARADIFIHNSGPSTLAWRDAYLFKVTTGKPFGVYGVTYGLYGIPERKALDQAAFVYFRDTVSLELARRDGVAAPILEWAPDAAFGADVCDDDKALAYLAAHDLQPGKYVCCNPNHRRTPFWEHKFKNRSFDQSVCDRNEAMRVHDHAPMIEAIVQIVRNTDLKVLIGHEDYTEIPIGKEWILDQLPEDVRRRVVWRDTPWNLDEAIGIFKHSAGLFSHEMHGPILCIANGIPAIVVRWAEQSSKGLMWKTIGLDQWLFDFDNEEDVKRYVPTVLDMVMNPEKSRLKAEQAREFVNQRQKQTMEVIRRVVQNGRQAD